MTKNIPIPSSQRIYNMRVLPEMLNDIRHTLSIERNTQLFDEHIRQPNKDLLISYFQQYAHLSETDVVCLADTLFMSLQEGIVAGKIDAEQLNNLAYWNEQADKLYGAYLKINKGNFGLSKATFEDLLSQLRQGNEQLFERVFVLHYQKCVNWLQYEYPKANQDDLIDATIDANIEFRKKLIEGKIKYGNMEFLFTLMAKQHYQKMLQKQKIFTLVDYNTQPLMVADIDIPEVDEQMIHTAERALQELCEQCRSLLSQFIMDGRRLVDMISEFGYKDKNAINKRKFDCLQKLRQHFFAFSRS